MTLPITLALDHLVPAAVYEGSLTDDSEASYDALVWQDERAKPAWDDVIARAQEDAPVAVPASVTRAQAKIALFRAGKLDAVKAAVAQAGGEIEIWFDDATIWERANPHVTELGTGLGMSASEIDGLFVSASQISA